MISVLIKVYGTQNLNGLTLDEVESAESSTTVASRA